MAKYKVHITYPDGSQEDPDDLFDEEDEAREYALDSISCWRTGAETLFMSNPGDNPYDESIDLSEYDIEEVSD